MAFFTYFSGTIFPEISRAAFGFFSVRELPKIQPTTDRQIYRISARKVRHIKVFIQPKMRSSDSDKARYVMLEPVSLRVLSAEQGSGAKVSDLHRTGKSCER